MLKSFMVMVGMFAAGGIVIMFTRAGLQGIAIYRSLGWLGRVIEALFIAALGALIGGALLYSGGSYIDDGFGVLIGVLGGLLLFPVFLVRSIRAGLKKTAASAAAPVRKPIMKDTPSASKRTEKVSSPPGGFFRRRASLRPDPDLQLEAAWERAILGADGIASEIAIARRSCRKFLNVAAVQELDSDAIDWEVFIRKQVPNLIESFFKRCSERPDERAEAMEALADSLQRIGAEADRRTARKSSETVDAFDLTREHIRRRTARDPFSS